MECSELAERLTDFLEGDLAADEEAAALDHLATCTSCETVLAETRDVTELAKNHGRAELSEEDRSAIWTRVLGETDDSTSS